MLEYMDCIYLSCEIDLMRKRCQLINVDVDVDAIPDLSKALKSFHERKRIN